MVWFGAAYTLVFSAATVLSLTEVGRYRALFESMSAYLPPNSSPTPGGAAFDIGFVFTRGLYLPATGVFVLLVFLTLTRVSKVAAWFTGLSAVLGAGSSVLLAMGANGISSLDSSLYIVAAGAALLFLAVLAKAAFIDRFFRRPASASRRGP